MIVEWLNAYLVRTSETGYTSDDAEVNELIALDDFLGVYRVRVSGDSGRLSRASPTQSHAPPSRKKGAGAGGRGHPRHLCGVRRDAFAVI